MAGILLVILVVLIFLMSCQKKSPESKGCDADKKSGSAYFTNIDDIRITESKMDSQTHSGLKEIEQTPRSRGMVPTQNQPDHIANLWKCDSSLSNIMVCEQMDKPIAYDFVTPLRGKVVNMNVNEASEMQKISRFGSVSS